MIPYQEAGEATKKQGEAPLKAIKTAGSLALGTAGGGLALSKVMPFLSKYIPQDLATKALSKIDPRFGKFIKNALGSGFKYDEVKQFIEEKAIEGKDQEPAKQNRNIIQQYSPELHEFIDQEIKSGRSPIEAGAIAQNDKRFINVIKKLSKEHKTSWSNILQSIYGGIGQSQSPQQSQPSQPSQQPGQGQQALMSILQKIQQSRGGQ